MRNYATYQSKVKPTFFTQETGKVIRFSEDIYRELAEKIRIEAEYSESDNPTITAEAERDGNLYCIELSTYLRYDRDKSPCGRPLEWLREILPTWCEWHTYDEFGDEHKNNFDINHFYSLL